jgi:hypothetical protein
MKYTKENIQGIVFKAGNSQYLIDHYKNIPNPRGLTIPSEGWIPECCIREFESGAWIVLEWPLKPHEIINQYEIY